MPVPCRARFPAPVVIVIVAATLLFAGPAARMVSDAGGVEEVDPDLGRRLDDRLHTLSARMAYKDSLARDLAAGRTTLAAVIAEFLRLNRDEHAMMATLRGSHAGTTDEERIARNVILYTTMDRIAGERRAEVAARLADEFEQMFGYPLGADAQTDRRAAEPPFPTHRPTG